ncbi:hypothetical protein F4820DRAFT_454438 [Hypoxylon rubiginosum]|uniref:Uncharacterized protein n=1 Tax=Hypoxylon rubiginosum TaxID=110542 RepID=A0ACB9YIL2_9PEZI|nr:hypothetical protein F4820DRAFT_454438 [Hypoxylon rubiginosum]
MATVNIITDSTLNHHSRPLYPGRRRRRHITVTTIVTTTVTATATTTVVPTVNVTVAPSPPLFSVILEQNGPVMILLLVAATTVAYNIIASAETLRGWTQRDNGGSE